MPNVLDSDLPHNSLLHIACQNRNAKILEILLSINVFITLVVSYILSRQKLISRMTKEKPLFIYQYKHNKVNVFNFFWELENRMSIDKIRMEILPFIWPFNWKIYLSFDC